LIQDLLMHRWTKGHPAPDAVGYMIALDRRLAGVPISARKLAEHCGWTRWHSTQLVSQVKAFADEWHQPVHTDASWPPDASNINGLAVYDSQIPASRQPDTSHHARGIKSTSTPQVHHLSIIGEDIEQIAPAAGPLVEAAGAGGGSPPLAIGPPIQKGGQPTKAKQVDLEGLWTRMELVRVQAVAGAKPAKLGKRREQLRARVSEHGVERVVHCWSWWWQSDDQRARFLRDGGYGVSTFLRAGKLRDYMDRADTWTPGADQMGAEWYTDDDFDEQGNLINTQG
jgi:hypothetical protein